MTNTLDLTGIAEYGALEAMLKSELSTLQHKYETAKQRLAGKDSAYYKGQCSTEAFERANKREQMLLTKLNNAQVMLKNLEEKYKGSFE